MWQLGAGVLYHLGGAGEQRWTISRAMQTRPWRQVQATAVGKDMGGSCRLALNGPWLCAVHARKAPTGVCGVDIQKEKKHGDSRSDSGLGKTTQKHKIK
jgi:hypothetical protein